LALDHDQRPSAFLLTRLEGNPNLKPEIETESALTP
jgi:hypothetical protein